MSDEKLKIISYSFEKFVQFGFQKTTVDQIAREMKISKKTVYKHFVSKDELVRSTLQYTTLNIRTQIEQIVQQEINAIEKINEIGKVFFKMAMKFSEDMFSDLRTHYHDIWLEIEEFRQRAIRDNFSKIIDQGKKEGFFVDRPTDIILMILRSAIQGVVNPEFLINHNCTVHEAAEVTFEIIFSGLMTKKGRKLYKQLKVGKTA